MKIPFTILAVLLAVALTGCDTFDRRARQKAEVFQALSPEQQEKLRRGEIGLGDSPDMVYIALGEPTDRRETATAAGHEMVWIYNSYYTDYEGQFHSGYRRHVVFDPKSRRYFVYHQPVFTDVYSEREEENIRVKFRDGRVAEIEQPLRQRS